MTIITNDEQLRAHLPNVFTHVEGETSLFEKCTPFIEQAERFLNENFLPITMTNEENTPMLRSIVACHAMMAAIPHLDLVLTPNGFGVVSNQTIAPASKERVDRLRASLEQSRDAAIDSLLLYLPSIPEWSETDYARFFSSTLFPTLSLCRKLNIRTSLWSEYLALRPQLIKIENVLADTYFSQELMTSMRQSVLQHNAIHPTKLQVIRSIQSLELMLLKNIPCHTQNYFDIVNIIRQHPDLFPEWHASEVAFLYTPPTFSNKKSSPGYWF